MPEPPPSIDWSYVEPDPDAVPPQEDGAGIWQRHWRLFVVLGVAAVLLAGGVWSLLNLGRWLTVQDPLRPAAAIVVLSGQMPARAIEAAHIYQQEVAPQVWVSQGLSPAPQLATMNITFLGEDFYNQKVLIAQGVPADAIHVLEEPAANTVEEVEEIARNLRARDAHEVIIVTSKAHTRRVRYIWKHLIGNDPGAIVRYAPGDTFDPAHWWATTSGALDVVRELLGLANAACGFPLHPEAH